MPEAAAAVHERGDLALLHHGDARARIQHTFGAQPLVEREHRAAVRVDPAQIGVQDLLDRHRTCSSAIPQAVSTENT